jgi:hypothetical protein
MSLAGRPVLERAGSYGAVRDRALSALREGNESPGGFRVRSPYRVIEIRRQAPQQVRATRSRRTG